MVVENKLVGTVSTVTEFGLQQIDRAHHFSQHGFFMSVASITTGTAVTSI